MEVGKTFEKNGTKIREADLSALQDIFHLSKVFHRFGGKSKEKLFQVYIKSWKNLFDFIERNQGREERDRASQEVAWHSIRAMNICEHAPLRGEKERWIDTKIKGASGDDMFVDCLAYLWSPLMSSHDINFCFFKSPPKESHFSKNISSRFDNSLWAARDEKNWFP